MSASRDIQRRVPYERWDIETSANSKFKFATFVEDCFAFDPKAFGMNDTESVVMDPQNRSMLLCTSGVVASQKTHFNSRSSIAIGCMNPTEYGRLLDFHGVMSALAPLGNGMSFLCGRLSYAFGFHGMCVAVDTACSSSLVAAHVAVLHTCDTSSSCVIGGALSLIHI